MREGPDHYTRLKPEPIDVIMAWGLDFPLGCVVKYVARWDAKGGVDDLRKARHFLDIYIKKLEEADPLPYPPFEPVENCYCPTCEKARTA